MNALKPKQLSPETLEGFAGASFMSIEERAFLLSRMPAEPGALVVEIGTWDGATIGWIARQRPDLRFVSVDVFAGNGAARVGHALANRQPNQVIVVLDTQTQGKDLLFLLAGRPFDGAQGGPESFDHAQDHEPVEWHGRTGRASRVIVDADHEHDACLRDLLTAAALLAPGGAILAHDYDTYWPGVTSAVDQFRADNRWEICGRARSLVILRAVTNDEPRRAAPDAGRAKAQDHSGVTTKGA